MKLLPAGLAGLVFAALIAAIVSSLASMMNSISTIFTMDIYPLFSKQEKTGTQLVTVGRITSLTAITIAAIVSRPLLGSFDQAFQYIQDYTGFFTPGVVAIFLMGIFWKKATAAGAIGAAIGSFFISLAIYLLFPTFPFIDRVGVVFLTCLAIGILISTIQGQGEQANAIEYKEVDTSTSRSFNIASMVVVMMLIALYATWW
jgi:SSS family solute:Na+ symporter